MAKTEAITQDRLLELFDYNPDGSFTRKVCINKISTHVGQVVEGTLSAKGYRRTKIDGTVYMHHRLVWIWHNLIMCMEVYKIMAYGKVLVTINIQEVGIRMVNIHMKD